MRRLSENERRFRAISRGVLRAQEAERRRISRELHDGVGQSLTALKMQLELLAAAAARDGAPLAPQLAELRDVADRSLEEVRQLCHLIRPRILDDLGLVPTLRWLTRTFERRTGIATSLACEVEAVLDPDVETLLYRVSQEALTNVARHARASSVRVRLHGGSGGLVLRIEDDGIGFDPARVAAHDDESAFGLRSMQDRVRLFAGRFVLRSTPGAGTTVQIEVPSGSDAEARA
jgi:signal transduction histidine kinase